jgi:hypothetical protein
MERPNFGVCMKHIWWILAMCCKDVQQQLTTQLEVENTHLVSALQEYLCLDNDSGTEYGSCLPHGLRGMRESNLQNHGYEFLANAGNRSEQ